MASERPLADRVAGQTSYANDFVDPDYILTRNYPTNTGLAQATINAWAKSLAGRGPWSVMDKAGIPPTGDKHDYLSWAPYWWPDCSSVGNTTALTEQEIWVTCPYVRRDGQFNPDVRTVNDVGNFQDLSETVFYNALAWAFTKEPTNANSATAVRYISTWFLDEATRMTPNLQKAATPTGHPIFDAAMISWSREYINWLETAPLALATTVPFYYNQLAALKLLVNDNEGAVNVTRTYFAKQFLSQIACRRPALDHAMTFTASASGEAEYAAELYPNVAAVASYASYLKSADRSFASQPYFFWNQPFRS
ncbi:hypothetical protein FA13DRAFT_1755638 [Coprinellus micaceus]|uniref:Alginate lyase domain-containing protein n=1 Tax=Coprinellus micaceus TaxID=71717 RepID=A0A4Y7T5H3_COPMI|nr:hypothetical protein FA13DRAFT_1755638 [Coprinellus micaceus]